MSPVLFLFVIQAFVDTPNLKAQPVQVAYFPENKNGNLTTIRGRPNSQDTSAKKKGTLLLFNTSFYVDNSFFYFLPDKNSNKPLEFSINTSPASASSSTLDPKFKNPNQKPCFFNPHLNRPSLQKYWFWRIKPNWQWTIKIFKKLKRRTRQYCLVQTLDTIICISKLNLT